MASGLLLLLDDIATILDDVALLTKVAAKKTAGVLGDDLALNAQQVIGIEANRELPVVWAVAKGSLVNKLILVPSALLLSTVAPWAIVPLLIVGGAYLCFEGCEKLAHKFLHGDEDEHEHDELAGKLADQKVDIVEFEKNKIRGAIRTDFILSAEIVVITLGTVAAASFWTRLFVLAAIAVLMTAGVYGIVAAIVKLDDLGARFMRTPPEQSGAAFWIGFGKLLVRTAPYLMKFLSIGGTVAMFLVGGGILAHGVEPLHHGIEQFAHHIQNWGTVGSWIAPLAVMVANTLLGVAIGAVVLLIVEVAKWGYRKIRPAH